ncbi:unnamed protein product [Darwinula stevensoni]|uniref:FYVE-type domain-containing protein n=1 Tax=Darwinula stevensoni TaxID=69355 RepID=A0A7R9A700_9CRUS|nr:unnamed protein product [Darwinula stevensoni]CAG0889557.1 unnamed protein product [Darwinula stevensoni]
MKGKRFETPEWQEGDACQQCGHPFFWNVRGIVGAKTMGVRRQHHCRRCGKAVCDPCSTHQAPLPCLGFEYPVRLCAPCHASLQPQDLLPMACFMDSKHRIVKVDIHEASNTLLTTGNDRLVKLWELPNPG